MKNKCAETTQEFKKKEKWEELCANKRQWTQNHNFCIEKANYCLAERTQAQASGLTPHLAPSAPQSDTHGRIDTSEDLL